MKIAVLFGSFNPMTNAHLAVMHAAMKQLAADKGLFVATNGQYLRRKTVKLDDPFYLTEDERKSVIESVCDGKSLSFCGFELGGINPSRYKTLCRIQKQYPDAEIYELMGADKVHTLYKSAHADEYLRDFRFAVFRRNGIDVEQMLADEPALCRYREAFTLLPALETDSEVSSTTVRQRFFAGDDYTDLVPSAAADVLVAHKPSDFTITYEERMKTLMRSGRFGPRRACKEVYHDNAQLFRQWREGTSDLDFGDYDRFLSDTRLYTDEYSVADVGTTYAVTETGCINCDCVDVAQRLIAMGYDPAILNLASAKSPGGGYHEGFAAQEESLCHSSTLSVSLYQYGSPRYKHIRESGVPVKPVGYPLDINFGGVYTPNVTFFRGGKSQFFAMREQPFSCDVITVAALSFNGRSEFSGVNELTFRSDDGGFTPDGEAIMLNKIRTIFRLGVEHGKDALVLGAFGCGAYRLPVLSVVRLFRQVMNEAEFAGKFRLLVFAIMENSRKPHGLEGKFADFYREFGTFR